MASYAGTDGYQPRDVFRVSPPREFRPPAPPAPDAIPDPIGSMDQNELRRQLGIHGVLEHPALIRECVWVWRFTHPDPSDPSQSPRKEEIKMYGENRDNLYRRAYRAAIALGWIPPVEVS